MPARKSKNEPSLLTEAFASICMGEGLQDYPDEELVELIDMCERNLQLVAAIDIYGDIIAVEPDNWVETRMAMKEAQRELRLRLAK